MERATTWRSSRAGRWLALWAQRLGWTLLYGLLVCGSAFVLFVLPDFVWPEDVGLIVGWPALDRVLGTSLFVGLPLGLLVVAFLIGVRLRSTWWGFGPPLAFGLAFFVLLLFTMWIPPPGGDRRLELDDLRPDACWDDRGDSVQPRRVGRGVVGQATARWRFRT